jgi:hypothetical protein
MKTKFMESTHAMPAGMVILPLRCTVVRLRDALVVISPIDFTPQQLREIAELGDVTHLVAPSVLHHSFMKTAIERFPAAKVWGVPGLREKRTDIRWDAIFGTDVWPFEAELSSRIVEGVPEMTEVSLFDRSTKTLIVVDLCFNLQRPEGWAAPVMLRLLGTHGKFAVSRLVTRFMKDKVAFRNSIRDIFKWDFDRIAMGHGDLVNTNGKSLLRDALSERGISLEA